MNSEDNLYSVRICITNYIGFIECVFLQSILRDEIRSYKNCHEEFKFIPTVLTTNSPKGVPLGNDTPHTHTHTYLHNNFILSVWYTK